MAELELIRKVLKTTFKLRRGKALTWQIKNPTLEDGEPGFEIDTNKLKIGDGVHDWNHLPYLFEGESTSLGDGTIVDAANGVIYQIVDEENINIIAERTEPIPNKSIETLFN